MILDQVLRNECMTALRNYADEAQRTCELLSAEKDFELPLERLLSICAQTQAENSAHIRYLSLRQRLMKSGCGEVSGLTE